MSYILDVIHGKIEPRSNRISLEQYVVENSYITKYLSRIVRNKPLAIYHVLFHLTYFETGKSLVTVPWASVGALVRSDQGNIDSSINVRRRLSDLLQNKCITVNRQRGGANEVVVHLPSQIPVCRELIQIEESNSLEKEEVDDADYYSNAERRLIILDRDNRRCTYCLVDVSEDSFVLDHIIPVSNGGTHRKFNLVTSCEGCNQRKLDQDAIQFLQSNYREQLISQNEYLNQKAYIEKLLEQQN